MITKEVLLRGNFSEDAATVTAAAERMVTTAKMLTGKPARNLSSSSPREASHLVAVDTGVESGGFDIPIGWRTTAASLAAS